MTSFFYLKTSRLVQFRDIPISVIFGINQIIISLIKYYTYPIFDMSRDFVLHKTIGLVRRRTLIIKMTFSYIRKEESRIIYRHNRIFLWKRAKHRVRGTKGGDISPLMGSSHAPLSPLGRSKRRTDRKKLYTGVIGLSNKRNLVIISIQNYNVHKINIFEI